MKELLILLGLVIFIFSMPVIVTTASHLLGWILGVLAVVLVPYALLKVKDL